MNFKQFTENKLSPSQKDRLKAVLEKLKLLEPSVKPALQMKAGCDLPHKILVGTHHKTGTVWLNNIFRTLCRFHSLTYFNGSQAELPKDYDVFIQDHTRFDLAALSDSYRGIHMVRDPRDVVLSGCFYHQKSQESWLHEPMDEYGGMTYQEKINTYSTPDEQILFEMENSGRVTINEMLDWDYQNPNFMELKYEDLIEDTELAIFHQIFSFLGFPGSAIPSALAVSFNKSLFSGKAKASVHIRSGKAKQWEKRFTQQHKERFYELFGDGLIKMGYETDNSWVSASSS